MFTQVFEINTGFPMVSGSKSTAAFRLFVINGTSCCCISVSFPSRILKIFESIALLTRNVFGKLSGLNLTFHEISGELKTVAVASKAGLLRVLDFCWVQRIKFPYSGN